MKKILTLLYIVFINTGTAYASIIPESMKQALKNESAGMPSLINLLLSMFVVIMMIYITGWVYQKLSRINRLKLSNQDFIDKNSFKVISSMPLGQHKNLYAVEINDKVLVVGATQQNISLIKEFDKGGYSAPFFDDIEIKDEPKDIESLESIYNKYKD